MLNPILKDKRQRERVFARFDAMLTIPDRDGMTLASITRQMLDDVDEPEEMKRVVWFLVGYVAHILTMEAASDKDITIMSALVVGYVESEWREHHGALH